MLESLHGYQRLRNFSDTLLANYNEDFEGWKVTDFQSFYCVLRVKLVEFLDL